MVLAITNQDCSTLSEVDLEHLAGWSDLDSDRALSILAKEKDQWVTAFLAKDGSDLVGLVMATLERIGGTPAVVLGLVMVKDNKSRVIDDLSRAVRIKARVAFPDEDVIFALRTRTESSVCLLDGLVDKQPLKSDKPGGEERAWGRRLAKRFEASGFDDTKMEAKAEDDVILVDLGAKKPSDPKSLRIPSVKTKYAVAWGWAQVELLEKYQSR